MIFMPIRAAEISPTKNGESVRVSMNHPKTTASIWVPIVTREVAPQANVKSRYRNTESGEPTTNAVVVNAVNLDKSLQPGDHAPSSVSIRNKPDLNTYQWRISGER